MAQKQGSTQLRRGLRRVVTQHKDKSGVRSSVPGRAPTLPAGVMKRGQQPAAQNDAEVQESSQEMAVASIWGDRRPASPRARTTTRPGMPNGQPGDVSVGVARAKPPALPAAKPSAVPPALPVAQRTTLGRRDEGPKLPDFDDVPTKETPGYPMETGPLAGAFDTGALERTGVRARDLQELRPLSTWRDDRETPRHIVTEAEGRPARVVEHDAPMVVPSRGRAEAATQELESFESLMVTTPSVPPPTPTLATLVHAKDEPLLPNVETSGVSRRDQTDVDLALPTLGRPAVGARTAWSDLGPSVIASRPETPAPWELPTLAPTAPRAALWTDRLLDSLSVQYAQVKERRWFEHPVARVATWVAVALLSVVVGSGVASYWREGQLREAVLKGTASEPIRPASAPSEFTSSMHTVLVKEEALEAPAEAPTGTQPRVASVTGRVAVEDAPRAALTIQPTPKAEKPQRRAKTRTVRRATKRARAARRSRATAPPTHVTEQVLSPRPAREDVRAALEAQRAKVKQCAPGYSGVVKVRINASPSGRVASALVGGDLVGTPAGSCIARSLRSAPFPKFSGTHFSVTYPFVL